MIDITKRPYTGPAAELLGIWFAPQDILHPFDGGRRMGQYAIITVKWPGDERNSNPNVRHFVVTRARALQAQKRGDLL